MPRLILLCGALLLALLALIVAKPHRAAAAPPPVGAEAPGLSAKPIHALRERDTGGASEYLVSNLVPGPIEVRCVLVAPQNVRSVPALPRTLVLPARAEWRVAELHVIDPARPAGASVACEAMVGDPAARPAGNLSYALPFPAGTRYTLDQGFGGRFSHHDPDSRYALDFGVPEGTPVLAARAGVVLQVEDDFRASGRDAARYGDRANYVRVLHDDGSMAVYAHLAPGSLLRRPGDRIVVGQLVGKSGNTGFSTGPHLHFSVQRNAGMALQAIPFNVVGVDPGSARN
jgi:murein DD-endopeptidase MepM/ murein hydrolase activator NlpD